MARSGDSVREKGSNMRAEERRAEQRRGECSGDMRAHSDERKAKTPGLPYLHQCFHLGARLKARECDLL